MSFFCAMKYVSKVGCQEKESTRKGNKITHNEASELAGDKVPVLTDHGLSFVIYITVW
jgi:hypothetical protein